MKTNRPLPLDARSGSAQRFDRIVRWRFARYRVGARPALRRTGRGGERRILCRRHFAGSIATLFGANLLDPSVMVDGAPATVFFADNRQVNFLVPSGISADTAQVSVTTALGSWIR